MQALKIYELNEVNEDVLLKNPVSFNSSGDNVSFFGDKLWNFKESSFCRTYQQGQYQLDFDFDLINGDNINDKKYSSLLKTAKVSVYIVLKEFSFATTKKHYYQIKPFLDYLVINDIFSFKNVTQDVIIGYRNYLYETFANENIIHKNLHSVKRINKQRKFLPDCFGDDNIKEIEHFFSFWSKKRILNAKQTKIIKDKRFKEIIDIANKNILNSENIISTKEIFDNLKKENNYYNHQNRTKMKQNAISDKVRILLIKSQNNYKNINIFKRDRNDLVFSCMILILAYTGMRIGEVLSIPEDCLKQKKTESKGIKYNVNYIKSTTFKYETDIDGTKNTNDMRSEWLANGDVVKAVKVLQRLYKEDRIRSGCQFLCCSVFGSNVKQISYTHTDRMIKELLNDIDFNIHQFRRTFARFVARSAFGEVDMLKEQFKHKTREITEYYMNGDVDSEFLEMIDESKNEIKESILWDKLLAKAKEDFGDELENKLKGDNND